jgi:xanthine dehydrogenase/oxidase
MNGLIDIGQAEGGFVMGLGFILLEKAIHDPVTGEFLNSGTWDYKPPMVKDIPIDFRISFIENKPNPVGILGSKAVGEPPLLLSNSILLALKQAIGSARKDNGSMERHFTLSVPAVPDAIRKECLINLDSMRLFN